MSAAVHTNGDGGDVEAVNTNIVTLTRFLTEEQAKVKEATGDFTYAVHIDKAGPCHGERQTELTTCIL